MNSTIISSFFLVILCCLSNNSVSSSAILEVASTSSPQPSNIANTNNDDTPTSNTSTTTYSNTILHQSISTQDAYIKASPLSVAAVCNDGIVMISLHYNVDVDDDEELTSSSSTTANEEREDNNSELASEKAQEIFNDDTAYTALVEKKSIEHQLKQQQVANKVFRDLPLSTRGPLRIEPINEMSTSTSSSKGRGEPPPMALLTAGWRTDGITLCDAARELISEEVRLYCLPTLVGISNDNDKDMSTIESGQDDKKMIENKHSNLDVVVKKDGTLDNNTMTQNQQQQPIKSYHGRRIAEGLSYYLAKCSFSEGIRSLSTIGLLACGTTTVNKEGSSGGSLYLVDATGIHSVRAHAIGNGSSNIHKRMVYVDFNMMDCQEGLKVLLRLIAEEGGLISRTGSNSIEDEKENVNEGEVQDVKKSIMAKPTFLTKRKNQKKGEKEVVDQTSSQPSSSWTIPSNTAVELGVIKSGDRRTKRIRLSSLFS